VAVPWDTANSHDFAFSHDKRHPAHRSDAVIGDPQVFHRKEGCMVHERIIHAKNIETFEKTISVTLSAAKDLDSSVA
jgi:hypothetical protein